MVVSFNSTRIFHRHFEMYRGSPMASTDVDQDTRPPHLAIIGGGVAGCAAASWAASHGARVTLFNAGLPLGGACIHVGTFPARLLMTAATDHHRAAHPRFAGLHTEAGRPELSKLNDLRRKTSEELRNAYHHTLTTRPNVELVEKPAFFIDSETLRAGDETFAFDHVLLTPGSHSLWPELEGIDDVTPLAIASLGDLGRLPESLVFVEINDVAMVYAQLFARLGTQVTILTEDREFFRRHHGPDAMEAMSEIVSLEDIEVHEEVALKAVHSDGDGVKLQGTRGGEEAHWHTEHFVVVDHRRPRIEHLGLDEAGVEVDEGGILVIDESLQTTNPRVFAAGDAIGRGSHAYAAAYDAILAARNAIFPSRTAGHTTAVPFAIYTDPEFAGVGWSEHRACRAGFDADTAVCPLDELPAACAIGRRRGYVKLIRDRRSDRLVGARIFAPHAAELIMELALAVRYGFAVSELGAFIHPPISLGEAIGRAARRFTPASRPHAGRPSP